MWHISPTHDKLKSEREAAGAAVRAHVDVRARFGAPRRRTASASRLTPSARSHTDTLFSPGDIQGCLKRSHDWRRDRLGIPNLPAGRSCHAAHSSLTYHSARRRTSPARRACTRAARAASARAPPAPAREGARGRRLLPLRAARPRKPRSPPPSPSLPPPPQPCLSARLAQRRPPLWRRCAGRRRGRRCADSPAVAALAPSPPPRPANGPSRTPRERDPAAAAAAPAPPRAAPNRASPLAARRVART